MRALSGTSLMIMAMAWAKEEATMSRLTERYYSAKVVGSSSTRSNLNSVMIRNITRDCKFGVGIPFNPYSPAMIFCLDSDSYSCVPGINGTIDTAFSPPIVPVKALFRG